MADSTDPKADISAENAYAAASEAMGDKDVAAAPQADDGAEPVEFPAKPKRARKVRVGDDEGVEPADSPVEPAAIVAPVEALPVEALAVEALAVEALAAPEPAPVAVESAPEAPSAKPRAPMTTAKPKLAVKRTQAKPTPLPVRKPIVQKIKTAPKAAPKPVKASSAAAPKPSLIAQLKEIPMDVTASIKDAVNGAQDKAKEAFTKTSAAASEYGEFAKGNVEAVVESGKILASGLQELGNKFIADSKAAFETATADAKALSSVKSPTEFFQFQTDLLKRNFETAVSYSTKTGEAMLKLSGDVIKPISGRVTLAVEKVKAAA